MKTIVENLAAPLARRAGTFIAGVAISLGATASQADAVELGAVAVAMIAVDLVSSYLQRRK